jgi:DNA replication initiation complex subunit (GINS family)
LAKQGIIEIDTDFYERWENSHLELAEVEKDLVILTDGLSSLEKKLMHQADESFYRDFNKRLPEVLQRREARRHESYIQTIKAKAQVQGRKILVKGRIEMMRMQFDEWRTRSADRRNSI